MVMDFIHNIENSPAVNLVKADVAGLTGNDQARQNAEAKLKGQAQGNGQPLFTRQNGKIVPNDQKTQAVTSLSMGVGEGAPTDSGAEPAAAPEPTPAAPTPDKTLDFLPDNQPPAGEILDDETATKVAQENDPAKVEKILEPQVGPKVAQDVAPSVAQAQDPNVAKNIVQDDVNNKVAPGVNPKITPDQITPEQIQPVDHVMSNTVGTTPEQEAANRLNKAQAPSPAPAPLPPSTPVSDINTPENVAEQGSAEEQSLLQSGDQLSPRDTPEAPFLNAPGEAAPGTASKVGKAGVMNEMGDIINSGGTTDDALMHYMQNVPGANVGDAHNALDDVINSTGIDKSKINESLNPMSGKVKFAPVKADDDMAAKSNGAYAGEKVGEFGTPAYQDMKALDEHDRELTRYLRGKNPDEVQAIVSQAHDPETFQNFVEHNKNYLDYSQASGAELGQPLPYHVNYGTRTPYDPPEGIPGVTAEGTAGPKTDNPLSPSYTKQRYFNTHEEALANGYTPINDDPLTDLKNDINQRAYNQSQLALANGLEQAHPGQVQLLNDGTPIRNGYHQLIIPGGDKIALPAEIADKINVRVMAGKPTTTLGKYYDSINGAGKATELGLGIFHGSNTMGTFTGQQLASGKAFTDFSALSHTVNNFFSKGATDKYFDDATKIPSGGIDENHSLLDGAQASTLNINKTSVDIAEPGEKSLAGKIVNLPGFKQIHDAVFDRQIPTMMLETFRQKTQGLDIFGNADDREAAMNIAKQINKEFGVVDHDYAGLTPKQFKVAGRILLAPGYQEGQLASLVDAFTKGGAEGKLAREAVFGKALLFGGLATIGGVAGGDFKDQTPKQVALGILNKAISPSFNIAGYKVSTPATPISEFAKPVATAVDAVKGGKSIGQGVLTGAEDFANSRGAFVPAQTEEELANKDFSGNALRRSDYFGRPISAKEDVLNEAKNISPIPVSQATQTLEGSQNVGAAVANTVGLSAHPQYNLNYAPVGGQTYVHELEKTPGVSQSKINATTEYFDLLGQGVKGKKQAIANAEKAINTNNPQKAQQIITDYNQKLIKTMVPWVQQGNTQYFDETMLQYLKTAEIKYQTANSNALYDAKTNPTAYGGQYQSLTTPGVKAP